VGWTLAEGLYLGTSAQWVATAWTPESDECNPESAGGVSGARQELLSIRRLVDPIREILFSPNGDWLAARTGGGLRLLDGSRHLDTTRTTASEAGSVDPYPGNPTGMELLVPWSGQAARIPGWSAS